MVKVAVNDIKVDDIETQKNEKVTDFAKSWRQVLGSAFGFLEQIIDTLMQ